MSSEEVERGIQYLESITKWKWYLLDASRETLHTHITTDMLNEFVIYLNRIGLNHTIVNITSVIDIADIRIYTIDAIEHKSKLRNDRIDSILN